VYKVLKVKSDFTKGKFEQTLDLVKMPNDLFYDDSPRTSPKVELQATVAVGEPTQSTPLAPVQENQVVDSTGLTSDQINDLKTAAAQPPTNPVPVSAGAGTVATVPQPTAAAPSNAGDALAVAPEQSVPRDPQNELAEIESEIDDILRTRTTEFNSFNATITSIKNDSSLTREQKADKTIRYREALKEVLSEQATQLQQVALRLLKVQETSKGYTAQITKLIGRAAPLQTQATQVFKDQTEKIKKIQETGLV
jgi:hypothetical protein